MLIGALSVVLLEAITMVCYAFRRIAELFLLLMDRSESEMDAAGIEWEPEPSMEALKAEGMSPDEIGEYRLARLRRLLEKLPPAHLFWRFLRRRERLGMVLHLFVLAVLSSLPICLADSEPLRLTFAIAGLFFMICLGGTVWGICRGFSQMIDAAEATMSLKDLQEGVNDNEDGFARTYERYLTRNMTRKRKVRSLWIGLGTVAVVLTAMIVGIPRYVNRIVPSPSTPGVFSSGQYSFSVQEDGTACILSYVGSRRNVEVPGAFGEYTVTAIGEEAFKRKELKTVMLPETVARIGKGAFRSCSKLESVDLSHVTEIEAEAFESCWNLEEVLLGEGLRSIGKEAFYGGDLRTLTIPAGVKQVGIEAFGWNTKLKTLSFLGSDTRLEGNPVSGNMQVSVTFPVDSGYVVSDNCILSADRTLFVAFLNEDTPDTYTVPEGVETIGTAAFKEKKQLKRVFLPDSLIRIESYAFYCCIVLEHVELPEGLLEIGENAFSYCYALRGIRLPRGLVSLGENCFSNCKSLTELVIPAAITSIDLSHFDRCEQLTITLPPTVTDVKNARSYYSKQVKLVRVVRGSNADKILRQAGIRMQYYDPSETTL